MLAVKLMWNKLAIGSLNVHHFMTYSIHFGVKFVCLVGFVASYNQSMTHWYSRAVFQERGQEIADSLKACLVDALKHYIKTNGKLPDRIIIYRYVRFGLWQDWLVYLNLLLTISNCVCNCLNDNRTMDSYLHN